MQSGQMHFQSAAPANKVTEMNVTETQLCIFTATLLLPVASLGSVSLLCYIFRSCSCFMSLPRLGKLLQLQFAQLAKNFQYKETEMVNHVDLSPSHTHTLTLTHIRHQADNQSPLWRICACLLKMRPKLRCVGEPGAHLPTRTVFSSRERLERRRQISSEGSRMRLDVAAADSQSGTGQKQRGPCWISDALLHVLRCC